MSQSLLTGFSDTKCSVKWSPPPLCPPPPSSASYIPESCRVESRPAAPPFIHQRLDWSASARPSPHAAMRCCDEVKSPRQVVFAARATCALYRRRPLVFCCISSPEVCFTSVFLLSHTHSLVFDLVVCVCVLGEGWGVTLTSPPPSQVLQDWTADLITARWGQSVSSLSACPDLSEPAQPPSSLRGANAFRASPLAHVTVQGSDIRRMRAHRRHTNTAFCVKSSEIQNKNYSYIQFSALKTKNDAALLLNPYLLL